MWKLAWEAEALVPVLSMEISGAEVNFMRLARKGEFEHDVQVQCRALLNAAAGKGDELAPPCDLY